MSKTQIIAEPGMPQIIVSREFAAPRELVFRAHIDPALLVRWLGPRELTMRVDYFDARDGGRWRYIHIDTGGREYGFHGVFHGTPSTDRIVQTFEFEDASGRVKLDTTTFVTRGDRTVVLTVSAFQSVADRDAMVATGMEHGTRDSTDRLEQLLTRLQAPRHR